MLCKDCSRAIALIQTAARLKHDTYNVGSGRVTTNAEIVTAIRDQVPDIAYTLAEGRNPTSAPADPCLDLTRIRQDTGYQPGYDCARGIADYIACCATVTSGERSPLSHLFAFRGLNCTTRRPGKR